MTAIYFLILAVLVVAGFAYGRSRASGVASGSKLHSLPAYHGLFTASAALFPMLAIVAIGTPLAAAYVQSSALSG